MQSNGTNRPTSAPAEAPRRSSRRADAPAPADPPRRSRRRDFKPETPEQEARRLAMRDVLRRMLDEHKSPPSSEPAPPPAIAPGPSGQPPVFHPSYLQARLLPAFRDWKRAQDAIWENERIRELNARLITALLECTGEVAVVNDTPDCTSVLVLNEDANDDGFDVHEVSPPHAE